MVNLTTVSWELTSPQPKWWNDIETICTTILRDVESEMGACNGEIVSVWVRDVDSPSAPPLGGSKVGIILPRNVSRQFRNEGLDSLRFHLAHELVHCLDPKGRSDTTEFEEAIATEFQVRWSIENGAMSESEVGPWLGGYLPWFASGRQFVTENRCLAKSIRNGGKNLSNVSFDLLLQLCPMVSSQLIRLCEKKPKPIVP